MNLKWGWLSFGMFLIAVLSIILGVMLVYTSLSRYVNIIFLIIGLISLFLSILFGIFTIVKCEKEFKRSLIMGIISLILSIIILLSLFFLFLISLPKF